MLGGKNSKRERIVNTNIPPKAFDIDSLSKDILQHIFSYLSPQDLLNAELVSHLWLEVSKRKEIWWNLISQHFPFLKEQAHQQYQANPKDLFITHYKKITQAIHSQSALTKFLLACLRGDMDEIDKLKLHESLKKMLYICCAANRHLKPLAHLSFDEIVTMQLIGAGLIGNLPLMQTILTQHGKEISAFGKEQTLRYSSASGQLNVVKALLTECGQEISDEAKSHALLQAASAGHLHVIQALLTQCDREISTFFKGEALVKAASSGHLDVVQVLLNQCGQGISADEKGQAMFWAASRCHFHVFQALLTQCGQEILASSKGHTLSLAASVGHLHVVQALLTQCGQEISADDKGEALRGAASGGHLAVVRHLLMVDAAREKTFRYFGLNSVGQNVAQQINTLINRLAKENPLMINSLLREERNRKALVLFSLFAKKHGNALERDQKDVLKMIMKRMEKNRPPLIPQSEGSPSKKLKLK